MPNIANVLKSEIARIARKEVRTETLQIKKQSTNYRSQIASLKRQVAALESLLRKQSTKSAKTTSRASDEDGPGTSGLRFRAKGFAAHRRRLGLSAAEAGAL